MTTHHMWTDCLMPYTTHIRSHMLWNCVHFGDCKQLLQGLRSCNFYVLSMHIALGVAVPQTSLQTATAASSELQLQTPSLTSEKQSAPSKVTARL